MSRYVPGRGFEPDPRGLNRNAPKVLAAYEKKLQAFYNRPLDPSKNLTIKGAASTPTRPVRTPTKPLGPPKPVRTPTKPVRTPIKKKTSPTSANKRKRTYKKKLRDKSGDIKASNLNI